MKKVLRIFLLLIMVFTLSACTEKDERPELKLVTEAGFAPFEYYENDKIVGVDIDIAKEIAKELDYKLVVKDVAFDSIISEVKTGKSDMGAAGISYTKERAKEVDFSRDYIKSKQIVVVKKDSDIEKLEDIKGSIAVQLGTVADLHLTENYPNVKLVREKKFMAAIEDLKGNKVDAVAMDEIPAKQLMTSDMKILEKPLVVDSFGIVVKKGNKKLLDATNKVIDRLNEVGKIDDFVLKHMDIEPKKEKNGIMNKIHNTLVKDKRYNYILEGLKNTILIALGAVIIGLIIGTFMGIVRNYHESTSKLKILNFLSKTYVTIIRGTPSILQLMIIYYVIFKKTSVNIVLVGIIAFGINSSAYIAEIIRAGINSVSKHQVEAGEALGLPYGKIMRYIVMPQAIKNILPALGNEFITLVKETAVGAYIGIVELTKASDIIASRTYDYFFPLIVIALIYLVITYSLTYLVGLMEKRLNNVRS